MKPYQSWEFCKSIDCPSIRHCLDDDQRGKYCRDINCKTYYFHCYLSDHGQILEEGSELDMILNLLRWREL